MEAVKLATSNLDDKWKEKRHYCVGVQTKEAAHNLLGLVNIKGHESGNAESLSTIIIMGMRFK